MNYLSETINRLSESETLAMTRKSRELKDKGFDVINLSIGEPDFNTPEHIKAAAIKAIEENYSHYTPVSGYAELRKAICYKLKRDNNLEYSPNQIVVSSGAKQSIANAIMCLVSAGEKVVVPAPYWVSYREIIKMAGGEPIYLDTTIDNDYKIQPEQMKHALSQGAKLFIYSSPCNPTGTVYSKKELREMADVFALNPSTFIISDEIYEHINFKGRHESIAQFEDIRERVIIVNGVSKGFAMTGWRLGFMASDETIAKACDKLQGQITSGASSVSQMAAIAAMNTDPVQSPEIDKMIKAFKERRNLVIDLLNDIPGIKTNTPDGAFYIFPDITDYYGKSDGEITINNSNDFCMFLLNKVYVAMVPGIAFGCDNCIRISYAASSDVLKEAMKRIKEGLSALK